MKLNLKWGELLHVQTARTVFSLQRRVGVRKGLMRTAMTPQFVRLSYPHVVPHSTNLVLASDVIFFPRVDVTTVKIVIFVTSLTRSGSQVGKKSENEEWRGCSSRMQDKMRPVKQHVKQMI